MLMSVDRLGSERERTAASGRLYDVQEEAGAARNEARGVGFDDGDESGDA